MLSEVESAEGRKGLLSWDRTEIGKEELIPCVCEVTENIWGFPVVLPGAGYLQCLNGLQQPTPCKKVLC